MKRTTVVLPDDLAALLERERRRRGVSAAAVVREALDAYFGERRRPLAIAALGSSGETTVAREADAILAREWTYEHLMGVAEESTTGGPAERADTRAGERVDLLAVDRAVDDSAVAGRRRSEDRRSRERTTRQHQTVSNASDAKGAGSG